MHRPIFGHSFAVLVAPILLSVLAFNFLNKKKASARRNEEDADTGAPGSSTAPAEANAGGFNSSPTGNCYEVFLSFRGSDTRKGFTDHLYNGLLNAGIDTFRDDDELCQGQDIRPALMEAITNSKVLIPIFSETYGTSSWCLDELVQIMEHKNKNGQIVLPIFYKVKPSDVGHQIGRFGKLFHEREKRLLKRGFDPTTLENRKKALLEVSNLSGYEADGSEADLVKSIVRKVLSELKKKFELHISENLVGIDSHVKKVMESMDNKSHAALFVGIHGLGGIGKTTLAKAIYNKLSNQFEHRSFIADIRESWKCNGAHYLQNKLIYDILNLKNEVDDKDEGTEFISSKFKRKKVLVLLDDVDDVNQVKCLAGNRDWFSLGSKIIITTRNAKILEEVGVDFAYDHKEMDDDHALILFSKHAFRRDSPLSEFKDLADKAVSIIGGLPLSLEVLGSSLCGRKQAFWRDTIEKIKKAPPKEVQKKLRISYEVLDNEQKQIFLDIACFFIGTDRRIASYMWDACRFFPEEGIEVLRFMSLIKIGDNHELRMHDQLRDLGREIVHEENWEEPENRSRLWDSEEVRKVLKLNKGTENIKAIYLGTGSSEGSGEIAKRDGAIYTEEQFKNLTSLRFLHMEDGAHLSGDFKDSVEELRWVRWKACPVDFEVNNFHPIKLVVLELQWGDINERWQGWSYFKMAEKLKFLDLSFCESLENTDFLSAFKNLVVLILNYCERLQQIDSSIGDMKALLRLELGGCTSLTELPQSIVSLENLEILDISHSGINKLPNDIGRLRRLRELKASGCKNMEGEMPESIGSLENLEILDISYSSINKLPNDIGRLRLLRELKASYCVNMEGEMPENIGSLENLEILNISYSGINKLPNDIGRLRQLRELNASGCKNMEGEMPESIGSLENLEILDISESGINKLPNDIGRLRQLRELNASICANMEGEMSESLGSLENLEILNISGSGISGLPNSIGSLRKLRVLNVSYCRNLKGKIPESVRNLSSLQRFDVEGCEELQSLPDLPSSLRKLVVTCQSHILPSLSRLTRLKELRVRDCPFLKCIPEFPPTLLKNSECSQLIDIEESESPQSLNTPFELEILEAIWCESLEILDVSQFIHLRELRTTSCENLLEVRGLDRLKYLERLTITFYNSQLDLPQLGGLKRLAVCECKNLVEIRGLDTLVFLEELSISQCASIERLFLPKSKSLKTLTAQSCICLAEIHGLDSLEFLETLNLIQCASIEKLHSPKSGTLKELLVDDCKMLVEIQGLNRLKFLEGLWIFECASIERLDLPKSERLKILNVRHCQILVEIHGLGRLEFLEELNFSGCSSIERLDLPESNSVKKLNVRCCESLVEIHGLRRLEFLEKLNLSGCASIERLPNLCCFGHLVKLTINGCDKLRDIQSLERFPSCKSLWIEDCKSLAKLPNLSSFHNLQKLFLSNCHELREIPGLEESISLKFISISGCSSIEILPDLSSCIHLISLIVQDCEQLTELRGLEKLEQLEELDISGCTSLKTIPELSGTHLYQNYEKKPVESFGGTIEFGLPYVDSDDSIDSDGSFDSDE